jgi:universal stress protein E
VPAYRHIVVGLDTNPATGALSTGSAAALACARWLAAGESVRCTLLHSSSEDELFDPAQGNYVASEAAAPAGPAVEAAARELREDGIATQVELTHMRAWVAIIRRVIEGPADLVVVGKRSEPEEGGPRLGSVAAKLLRKCPSAVWAVRPGSEPPPRVLLAACDLTNVGERVLERACQVAQRAQAPVHVVHTLQLTMQAQLEAERSDYLAKQTEAASRSIRATLERVGYRGKVELHVGLDCPTRAILDGTERLGADLVVMGTIARGGVSGLLLGNTAERLLQRVPASLLTVKPADFVCPIDVDRVS